MQISTADLRQYAASQPSVSLQRFPCLRGWTTSGRAVLVAWPQQQCSGLPQTCQPHRQPLDLASSIGSVGKVTNTELALKLQSAVQCIAVRAS